MFKKLQRRFMLVSTLVLVGVISLVAGIIYLTASGTVMTQTRVLMELILENDGQLPKGGEFNQQQETFLALNTESIYETRYFSVRTDGEESEIVSMHIAALSEEEAESLAQRAFSRKSTYGRLIGRHARLLHFAKQEEEDGAVMIVFLDATSRLGLIRLVMIDMAFLWFLVILLYIIIMGRYSGKLVQPFVENDERQKRFITNASHELKTPLAVISANTEMAELMGGKTKWTESTRRQLGRLQSLIEDLVVLTRLDEMKEADLVDVDFSAIAQEAAESFRSVVEGSGRAFHAGISPEIHVKAEKRSLQQLTTILLDNAAKYCDEGGSVTVTLTHRSRGKGARLAVSNTYAEGKEVDYSRFFERFYRQDTSHNSGKSGFGIGLSMGKEIAERMGGKLKVRYNQDMIVFTVEM